MSKVWSISLLRKVEKVGTVEPGEEKAQVGVLSMCKILGSDISGDVISNLRVCTLQALKCTSRYGQELIGKCLNVLILLPVLILTGTLTIQRRKQFLGKRLCSRST